MGVNRVTLGEGEVKTLINKRMLRIIQSLDDVQCYRLGVVTHTLVKRISHVKVAFIMYTTGGGGGGANFLERDKGGLPKCLTEEGGLLIAFSIY